MASPRPNSGARLLPVGLGSLGGLVYAASIPKAEMPLLAWICLVPPLTYLLVRTFLCRSPSTRQMLAMGLTFGLVAGCGRIYWIAETLENYGGLGPVLAAVTNGLLVLYLALYPACFFAAAGHLVRIAHPGPLSRSSPVGHGSPAGLVAFPWLAASAWVALEWVQGWLFTGFPWQLLGYSQYRDLALVQIASLTGVYGVSFALVAVNAAAAVLLALVWVRRASLRQLWTVAPIAALMGGVYAYGAARLDALEGERAEKVHFGIVQGNVPQDQKWKAQRKTAATTELYVGLTRHLMASHPQVDIILFPETALPYYFTDPRYRRYADQIRDLARQVKRPILVGSLEGRSQDGLGEIYNRAYMLDAEGETAGHADKVHLVPFGEYLPLPWLFEYLEGLTAESGRFAHGEGFRTVPLPGTPWQLGVFICYESIFPEISRTLTRLGAHLLVNTTNDAWFGTTAAPHQHLAMAALRAVETGRAVVRAANTGISGAISPSGAILAATPLFSTTVLAVEVPIRTETTPYVAHGDLFVWLCLGLLAVSGGHHLWRRGRLTRCEIADARQQIDSWSRSPRPLRRPLVLLHGYASDRDVWLPLERLLETCAPPAGEAVLCPDLKAAVGIVELATRVCRDLPEGRPADLVGHSMGALVACEVARRRACGDRVFALAIPLGGTRLAKLGNLIRLPYRRQLTDMAPGSAFLTRLAEAMPNLAPFLRTWRMKGDPAAGSGHPNDRSAHREYRPPPWVGPAERHRLAHTDPRILRDVLEYLRG